jgi:hypothetical protein
MDEIFGYFPPVAHPPSKLPLLTLLKQARAFGLGVVLATQNPVDLDYKGLANAGTWFVGRLQTERDKARLLDGLEGAAASTGAHFDRARIDAVLAGLGSRVFLMNNVHEDAPLVFQSRWSLSYLRGPLTRQEIKRLTGASPAKTAAAATPSPAPQGASQPSGSRPVLPPEVQQQFAPPGKTQPPTYRPLLLGAAQVRFLDAKTKVDVTRDVIYVTEISSEAVPVDWAAAKPLDIALSDLEPEPPAGARFLELPAAATKARNYAAWTKAFTTWLAQSENIQLLRSPSTGAISNAGETERDFRARIQHSAREERDQCAEDLRKKYAPKIATLEERLRRAQQAVERESEQASAQKMSTAISVGATLLGAFLGRKSISRSTLGRATTAARSASRTLKESNDVRRASETVEAIQQQLDELNAQFQHECDNLDSHIGATTEQLETINVRPKKTAITTKLVCLTWVPI